MHELGGLDLAADAHRLGRRRRRLRRQASHDAAQDSAGNSALDSAGDSALGARECWTTVTHRRGEDMDRVTLTATVINRAAQVAFLVTGEGKAAILREVLEGDADPHQLPARLIRPEDGELLWLVDRKAGSLLRHESNISLPR